MQFVHGALIVIGLAVILLSYVSLHSRYSKAIIGRKNPPFDHNMMAGLFLIPLAFWMFAFGTEAYWWWQHDPSVIDPPLLHPHLPTLICGSVAIVMSLLLLAFFNSGEYPSSPGAA